MSLFLRDGSLSFLQDSGKRLPQPAQGEAFSVRDVSTELDLCHFPSKTCLTYQFLGQDTGCDDLRLCSAQAQLISPADKVRCANGGP